MSLAALAALLLSACGEPEPAPAESGAPSPAVSAAEVAAGAPAAGADAPGQPDAAPANAPAADGAGERAVDERIDRVLGDHAAYRDAFARLQRAVAAGDATAVAALVDYPLTATVDGRKATIEDADAFVARYDRIVTPAIAGAVTAQAYADLMVNDQGVMFGSGEVWLNGICEDPSCQAFEVKVVAIQPGARE